MDETKLLTTPVAIIGGGPVGLMLALLLDGHGIASTVFNSEGGSRLYPKGSTQNARTMEHYRRVGITQALRKVGLPWDYPTDVVYQTRLNGCELARIHMPSEAEKAQAIAESPVDEQVPEPILRTNQMYVDAFLLAHARTRPNITLRFGWTVDRLDENADHVVVSAEGAAGREDWRCAYAIGCDGPRSFVRRHLGIRYQGETQLNQEFHGGRMISTHVKLPSVATEILGARRAWQYWVMNAEQRAVLLAVNGRDEFALFSRPKDEDPLPTPEDVVRIVQRCANAPLPVEVLAQSPWNSGVALHAESFGSNRLLLAGDSAHLFTPTGGFGMNTGIDDAANLAWKIAAMVQGWGGAKLLDSYEAERRPIAVRNTNAAFALAKQIGGLSVPKNIEQDDAVGVEVQRSFGQTLGGYGAQFDSIGVQLGARYDNSVIVVADTPPPKDEYLTYTPSGVPGGRTPHFWIGNGRGHGDSLYDQLGTGFTLLRLSDRAEGAERLLAAAAARGIPCTLLDSRAPEASALYEAGLALIRPDQHLAWRGDRIDHAELLLKTVTGEERRDGTS